MCMHLNWMLICTMVRRWSQTSGASFWPVSGEDIDQLRWFNHGGAGTKMSDTMLTNWFMGGQDTHPPISTLY